MLAFSQIREHIIYRLQNVEYQTFLERRDDGEGTMVMRPMRSTSAEIGLKQQWYLSSNNNNEYEIRNVNNTEPSMLSLDGNWTGVSSPPANPGTTAFQWHLRAIDKDDSKSPFYIYHNTSTSKNYRLLYVDDHGKVSVSKESFTTASRINCPEEYQWNVVEVNPTLLPDPKKKDDPRYRIRTLNGEALYAESDSKLAIGERVEGAQRHWLIVDKGNGRCTVQNAQNKKYLAASGNNSRWEPDLSSNVTFWDIEPIGPYNHKICVDRPYATGSNNSLKTTTFALTMGSGTVLFKPMKSAHNQIWLIEPVDAPLDGDTNQGRPEFNLAKGDYKFRNERLAEYIYVDARTTPPRFAFDNSDGANPFYISFNGSNVFIAYDVGFGRQYLSISNNALVSSNTEYSWTFEPGSNLANRYYIYSGNLALCANLNSKVVSVQQRTSTNEELWLLESA